MTFLLARSLTGEGGKIFKLNEWITAPRALAGMGTRLGRRIVS